MSFLRLEGLQKVYGDVTAVENVDLSIEKGEFLSLLGPSGCGKTTTLQMIAGFEIPTAGRVLINGRDMTGVKPSKRALGIVFQSYALFHHMTVFDNVAFGLEMRRVPKSERADRVRQALDLVRLGQFEDRFPRQLSGGQQQRVALARALVIEPEVLLLDEPLSALDAKIREEMQIELRAIQRKVGTTTILVTHDQNEAMAMSDRIAVMNRGQLAQVDRPYQAYEHPQDSFVTQFLGQSNVFRGAVRAHGAGESEIDTGNFVLIAASNGLATGTPVEASIRPEKLRLVEPGEGRIDGRVAARIFLGNHWIFQIETPHGPVTVVSQNIGAAPVDENTLVGIDWHRGDVRVLAATEAHYG